MLVELFRSHLSIDKAAQKARKKMVKEKVKVSLKFIANLRLKPETLVLLVLHNILYEDFVSKMEVLV